MMMMMMMMMSAQFINNYVAKTNAMSHRVGKSHVRNMYKFRVANPPGLTRSLQVLTSGLWVPGLVLQSPGC